MKKKKNPTNSHHSSPSPPLPSPPPTTTTTHLTISLYPSVIQYQLHLIETYPNLSTSAAYDIARKEFYAVRLEQDIQKRVAAEEALSVGAIFDTPYFDIMFEREGQVLREWRNKASQDLAIRKHRRNAAYSSTAAAEDAAAAAAAKPPTEGPEATIEATTGGITGPETGVV